MNGRFSSGIAAVLIVVFATQAQAQDADNGRLISETRFGVLAHDVDFLANSKEDGIDINTEVLFNSPNIFRWILSPRPHLGATINTSGNTSLFYGGVTWDVHFFERFFAEASLGGAVHTGQVDGDVEVADEKNLGCRGLFRLGASVGYQLTEHFNISAVFAHSSNARLCDGNEGLNNAGVRVGFRF